MSAVVILVVEFLKVMLRFGVAFSWVIVIR